MSVVLRVVRLVEGLIDLPPSRLDGSEAQTLAGRSLDGYMNSLH